MIIDDALILPDKMKEYAIIFLNLDNRYRRSIIQDNASDISHLASAFSIKRGRIENQDPLSSYLKILQYYTMRNI